MMLPFVSLNHHRAWSISRQEVWKSPEMRRSSIHFARRQHRPPRFLRRRPQVTLSHHIHLPPPESTLSRHARPGQTHITLL